MGVGGHFWETLKPYARYEGFDFLRNKKVAVDLSFWIVQHETALKANARNPHLRLTFFRTINLFSKFGALPVFIADGSPSPLKGEARMRRFFRSSGIDKASFPATEESIPVERNHDFQKCVKECVEMLKLLGMPVLTAKGEAEALCSQLNAEGLVDACITADSDALLYGATCVIKSIRPDSKEPFECYHMPDITSGLGLKRKHLVAVSLLVGNDFDLDGVQGIGVDTAIRFVERFNEDEIFDRLNIIASGTTPLDDGSLFDDDEQPPSPNKFPQRMRTPHCSFCGHPGTKTVHLKVACEHCPSTTAEGCSRKPAGFRCECSSCAQNQKEKEKKKDQNWQLRVCEKIATKCNFPNNEIIEMYMGRNNENYDLSWGSPQTDTLVEFLAYHQHWAPSYIRQRMLPMLSTIFLREIAENPTPSLLYGQYEFDSIERVKVRYGHPFYVVRWKKSSCIANNVSKASSGEPASQPTENEQMNESESESILDDPDGFEIHIEDGISFLLTDENVELVQHAFPEKVKHFLEHKGMKESKRKAGTSESPSSRGQQLTITEFYQSTKLLNQGKVAEHSGPDSQKLHTDDTSKGKSPASPNLPKSVRRRLLFD